MAGGAVAPLVFHDVMSKAYIPNRTTSHYMKGTVTFAFELMFFLALSLSIDNGHNEHEKHI